MDVLTKAQRSYNMSQIRGKNTKPEIALRKALWNLGLRYRLHYKLPGKPDIVFIRQKVVVFVDGCFWHGCPKHSVSPKTNSTFWSNKIQGNIERDKRNDILLKQLDWKVLRIWEHDVKKSLGNVVDKIQKVVERKNR